MTTESNQPFFELRQYQILDGQLDRWVAFMDKTLIPFQRSCGMIIVGSWFVRETNQYVWIRRFESQADKERLYKAAYKNDTWLNELKPIVYEMLDRDHKLNVREMSPSPLSIIR